MIDHAVGSEVFLGFLAVCCKVLLIVKYARFLNQFSSQNGPGKQLCTIRPMSAAYRR